MTTTESRVSGTPMGPSCKPGDEQMAVPAHQKWYRFVRKPTVLFWVAISLAGLMMALVPAAYPAKELISSAIVGAGIAGLLSEFTFSLDRSEADTNMRFERQHQASLEKQIGGLEHGLSQVDTLVKRTKIVATNQLLHLGLDLYMIRFGGEDKVAIFTEQAQKLAGILELSAALMKFFNSPYLHPTEPIAAEQDPFLDLARVVQLRYAQEGIEAFKAGASIGLILTAPGALAQEDYQDLALSTLGNTLEVLYLPPQVYQNLRGAMRDMQSGVCPPVVFAQYLALFSFYFNSMVTGRNQDILYLFESPISLAEPSRAAEIASILARYAGEAEKALEPAAPGAPQAARPEAMHKPEARLGAGAPEPKAWYKFIRKWSVFFWGGVSAIGLILAFLPLNFAIRDLFISAIVGAGIAGLISEFTFWPDRRTAEIDLQVQRNYEAHLDRKVEALEHQVDQVDERIRRGEIISISQLFKLGVDLHMVRLAPEGRVSKEQIALFRLEAEELATILGLSPSVGTFLTSPYLGVPDSKAPKGQAPWPDLIQAVELRYPQEGIEAFKAGSAIAVIINAPSELQDKDYRQTAVDILRRAIEVLYLHPVVHDNIVRAVDELLDGAYPPNYFAGYLSLFYFYISYRATGEYPEVASFFEAPASLAQFATVAEITRLLDLTSGKVSAAPLRSQPL